MKTLVMMALYLMSFMVPVPPLRGADSADVLNQKGSQLYAAGHYADAESALRESLDIQRSTNNADPGLLAHTLFNLAAVERAQSRLSEAEKLYQSAIANFESVDGPDSPQLARSLAGLALLYASDGRIAQAADVAGRAVRVGTADHADIRRIAAVQNSLASILLAKGEPAKAEELEKTVGIQLRLAGYRETVEYLDAITNLGTSRLRQANFRQAELDFREAESVALQVTGPDHPHIAAVWNNLGTTLEAEGDWKNAEILYLKSIAVWRSTLGPEHPDLARGLSNLAASYRNRKQYAKADRLFREALQIDETALGSDSLRAANDWNNIGALAAIQHHYRGAESGLSKGLSIAEQKVGGEHPDTASLAVNLAFVYYGQEKYDRAVALFARALPVKEFVLGPDSPELARIMRVYAHSLKATHDYAAAEKLELRATRITTHNALLAEAR